VVGVVGLLFAWLLSSHRGRRVIDAWRARHPRRNASKPKRGPSWVETRLSGASVRIAFLVGAAINLPGPFYLLAPGDIATGHGTAEQLALILLFNAIMFLLLEIPLIGYLFDPDWTARAVAVSGVWLNANGLRILGALMGVFSVSPVIQGITAVVP
jgi:hypothetical protein